VTVRLAELSRRTRLAIATVVALGTASPLLLFSAPGAPSPSWVQAVQSPAPAAELPDSTTVAPSTTTTTPAPAPTTPATALKNTAATTPTTAKAPRALTAPGAVTNTTAAPTPVSTVTAAPGPPRPCTTADISVTVTTDHPSYLPGDTVTITVMATNVSSDVCALNDPPQVPPNGQYCQPQVTVYAPYDPSQPTIISTEAVVSPACLPASTHTLKPGLAWPVTVTVPIPTSGTQWPPGIHRVNAYWVGPPVWKSGDATFTLTAPQPTATTTPATKP
jgi:hypothetical protein